MYVYLFMAISNIKPSFCTFYIWPFRMYTFGNLIFLVIWYILLSSGIFVHIHWYYVVIWYIVWSSVTFCGHLVYFVVIWYILWPFGIFCGHPLYFVVIWYILWPSGIFCGHLVYFEAIWYILWYFGIFYGILAYFKVFWYILWYFGIFYGIFVYFSRFGMLYQEQSGNPGQEDYLSSPEFFLSTTDNLKLASRTNVGKRCFHSAVPQKIVFQDLILRPWVTTPRVA
jgi:hypothetical protein